MPNSSCDICGKGPSFGSQVSHAHNVSAKKRYPNIQRMKILVKGSPQYKHVCTRCLRSGKIQKA